MEEYKKANSEHPSMGLDNKLCIDPVYWCRLHEVWLSKKDVKRKHCMEKPTFDMISTCRCGNLEKRDYSEFRKKCRKE